MTAKVYTTDQPNTRRDVLEAREKADLGVQQELAVAFARWSFPAVLSSGEARQRASDLAELAKMAEQAAVRR